MGAYVPVRSPRGATGTHGALVPVCLDPYVPVPDMNRDQWASWGIGPGSWQEPGLKAMWLYIPLPREKSTPLLYFFLECEGRALWCSSSPPMHMRCSMKCPSHTT